ncbi:hypothetical protein [Streptomyces sp. NPDC003635]
MTEWRPAAAAVAGALLLTGCTSGAELDSEERTTTAPTESASGTDRPSASATAEAEDEPYTLAEELAPRTRSEAVAFVRNLATRPDNFGPGFRKARPFESDPAQWAVLDENCVWQRQPLPATVLASLTRRFVLPESGAKGAVRVSLTVTVHRDTTAARRDMATSLEEAMRCPAQQLNATERVRGLYSRADPFSERRNAITDDDLVESGQYLVDGAKDALPFDWFKYRLGPVTIAATDRIGAGYDEEAAGRMASQVAQGVGLTAAEIDGIGGNRAQDDTDGKDKADGDEDAEDLR